MLVFDVEIDKFERELNDLEHEKSSCGDMELPIDMLDVFEYTAGREDGMNFSSLLVTLVDLW
jgi:hypothetical protein